MADTSYTPPLRGTKFTLPKIKAKALLSHLRGDRIAEPIYRHIKERIDACEKRKMVSFYISDDDMDGFTCVQYACMEAYFESMISYNENDQECNTNKETGRILEEYTVVREYDD